MEPDPSTRTRDADQRPAHRVLHLVADRAEGDPSHSHVTGVETQTSGHPWRWTLAEFVEATRRGERFHLRSEPSLAVEPETCAYCGQLTITTVNRPTHG